jgi:hypothetical protein
LLPSLRRVCFHAAGKLEAAKIKLVTQFGKLDSLFILLEEEQLRRFVVRSSLKSRLSTALLSNEKPKFALLGGETSFLEISSDDNALDEERNGTDCSACL